VASGASGRTPAHALALAASWGATGIVIRWIDASGWCSCAGRCIAATVPPWWRWPGPTRPADVLQLLGDGLAVALGARLDGVRPVVVECVAALRARGWDGHVELADQLDALRGRADAPAPGAGGGTSSDCPRFSKATR
jgi:hypothetical protein